MVARDVLRAARRPRLHTLRVGVIAACTAFLLVALAALEDTRDVAGLARLGRTLFEELAIAQMLLVAVLAPLLCGIAVTEEREDGTVDLLVLTRLTSAEILLGRLGSALGLLGLVVLGGLPIVALVQSLGGISPGEIAASYLATATVALVTGLVGACFALYTRGPLLPLAAVGVYAPIAFLALPALGWLKGVPGALSPAYFSLSTPFQTMRGRIPWLVTSGFVARMAIAAFGVRLVSPRTEDPLEGYAVGGSAVVLGSLVAVPVVMSAFLVLPDQALGILVWLWTSVFAVGGTLWFVQAGTRGLAAIEARSQPGQRAALRREVGPFPVLWREIRTRAFGPVGPVLWATTATCVVFLAFARLIGSLDIDEHRIDLGLAGLALATVATSALSVAAMTEERGTLALLVTTTLPAGRIVLEKLAAVLGRSLPLALLGGWTWCSAINARLHLGEPSMSPDAVDPWWWAYGPWGANLLPTVPWLRWVVVGWCVLLGSIAVALAGMGAAMRLPSRLAWVVAIAGPWLFFASAEVLSVGPWLAEGIVAPGLPPELAAATLLYGVVSVALYLAVTREVREIGRAHV